MDDNSLFGKDYQEKIKQEADFWGRLNEELFHYGIPWWGDLHIAQKISVSITNLWYEDPWLEQALRGKEKIFIIETASKVKGHTLDLGCGTGWLSLELARRGMQVDAVDVSPKCVEIAKEILKKNLSTPGFGSINYWVGDLNQIKLKKNTYDSVVIWDTLHHILNLDYLMAEVENSLKSHGVLLVYDHIGFKEDLFFRTYKILKVILKRLIPKDFFRKKGLATTPVLESLGQAPFEGAGEALIVDSVRRIFKIKMFKKRLSFLLTDIAPRIKSYSLILLLADLDRFLCNLNLIDAEYVFIVAKKRNE